MLSALPIGPFEVTFESELPYLHAGESADAEASPTQEIKPYKATIYDTIQKTTLRKTIKTTCTKQ